MITPDNMLAGVGLAVYVEDNADSVWRVWFPPEKGYRFIDVGSKVEVRRRVQDDLRKGILSFGVVDRDFDDDQTVENSLAPDSHVHVISRYAVENYLLEPHAIARTAAQLPAVARSEPQWREPTRVEQFLLHWARDLRFYAAGNCLIDGWNRHIRLLRFFRPGQLDHLFDRDYIVQQLLEWTRSLPVMQDIEHSLDAQAARIEQACQTLQGVHRWIDGKTLLSSFLHPRVFHAVPMSAGDLRRYLAKATCDNLPSDLLTVANRWKR